MRRRWQFVLLGIALVLVAGGVALYTAGGIGVVNRLQGKATLSDRVEQYGPRVRESLAPTFRAAGVQYPPDRVTIAAFKNERALEVYASRGSARMHFIKSYPILGASGKLGPKLREGDMQVPEGIYRITFLNPNSQFRLSLRMGYPNEFDRAMAERDGRRELGGDIMIHGGRASIGCLAMGDDAAEELFVLAADTGTENIRVILSPVDFRKTYLPAGADSLPQWTEELYREISEELSNLPVPD